MSELDISLVIDWNGRPQRVRKPPPLTYWEEFVATDEWYVRELVRDIPPDEWAAAVEDEDWGEKVVEDGDESEASEAESAEEDVAYSEEDNMSESDDGTSTDGDGGSDVDMASSSETDDVSCGSPSPNPKRHGARDATPDPTKATEGDSGS